MIRSSIIAAVLGGCVALPPPESVAPHVEFAVSDCQTVVVSGSGFAAGAAIALGWGTMPSAAAVRDDGTFAVELHRSVQEGQSGIIPVTVHEWASGFAESRDIAACPVAGCN